jgi:hypothetical protein
MPRGKKINIDEVPEDKREKILERRKYMLDKKNERKEQMFTEKFDTFKSTIYKIMGDDVEFPEYNDTWTQLKFFRDMFNWFTTTFDKMIDPPKEEVTLTDEI